MNYLLKILEIYLQKMSLTHKKITYVSLRNGSKLTKFAKLSS